MRITGGNLRGAKLTETNFDKELRPTMDRSRESLFNILANAKFVKEIGFEFVDSTILDLCCGTGIISFELISRGVKNAVLLDKNQKHLEIAKKNAQKLKISSQCRFVVGDILKPLDFIEKFDLVFIDPPYNFKFDKLIRRILESKSINEKTLIIIESNKVESFSEFETLDQRKYGISYFNFFKKIC